MINLLNRNRIKIGLEIECVYNTSVTQIKKGSYHKGIKKGKYWSIENDCSVNGYNSSFEEYDTIEAVSKVFGSKKLLMRGLEEFKSFFGNNELYQVLEFNRSCGCHFHIGLNGNKKYSDFLGYEELKSIRTLFFKSINKSTVLSQNTKEAILKQYYRDYAQKITKDRIINGWDNNRRLEFNKRSEDENKGLEWRSLNLHGVKTWVEFFEVMEIIYKCINKMFVMRTTGFKRKAKNILTIPKEHKSYIIEIEKLREKIKVCEVL